MLGEQVVIYNTLIGASQKQQFIFQKTHLISHVVVVRSWLLLMVQVHIDNA